MLQLDVKTVIVDEAGELFESDLLAGLPISAMQLILIGWSVDIKHRVITLGGGNY